MLPGHAEGIRDERETVLAVRLATEGGCACLCILCFMCRMPVDCLGCRRTCTHGACLMLNLTPFAPSAPSAPPLPPVLVIDDNQATRHSLASLLHVHGYRVSESSDGEAAIRLL